MGDNTKVNPATAVAQEARQWLIRLDGDEPLTREEADALADWLKCSPSHRNELKRLAHFWNQANILTELMTDPLAGRRALWQSRMRRFAVSFATVLVLAFLGWWKLHTPRHADIRSYQTAVGQQRVLKLSDGTTATMNTDSQMQVAYSEHKRVVYLSRGEVLLGVAADPTRVFEVYAGQSITRALGTAFSVHLEDGEVIVTVTKGLVDVAQLAYPGGNRRFDHDEVRTIHSRLKEGQTTTVKPGETRIDVQQLSNEELQRRVAWRNGYLVFSGQSLGEIVQELNRYSPTAFQIGDPRLGSILLSGRFKIDNLDALIGELREFDIQPRQIDRHTIRLESSAPTSN